MSAESIRFDPAREEDELRTYLGEAYEHSRLQQYQVQLDDEFAGYDDEASFYRTSEGYLYNLTAFSMTGTKLPYLERLLRLIPPRARLLDYGCGIGSDGLMLLEAGYRVEFADFDNPSVRYLRWRLAHRGLDAPIHDLDHGVPGGFDAGYSFDVIEHVDDPFAFLGELERRVGLVVVNFLEPEPGETDLHHELPVRALVDHAAARTLRSYSIHHGRSHLVLYEPAAASAARRLATEPKVALVRARRRLAALRR